MYLLHIANKNYSSWSLRPWLLLRQLGIAFTEQLHLFPSDASWRNFSPSGKVPCLHHAGRRIWDSLAIADYVAEDCPEAWPADRTARAWARSAAAEMHSGFQALRSQCTMNCGVRVRMREINGALAKDIARIDELWSEGIKRFGGPFLAGSAFTAVDAFYAPVAFRVQTYGLPLSESAAEYCRHLLQLPGMQEWYEAALQETPEPEHEADMLAAGELIADFRKQV
ncbi:glutathione S-transferase family protein [Saccharophagus sp. K07]|uniref:glutathione S-transferase family protein n=1 Tax=Saccharophagus sp. K07 TaxID=2283636 RepID=UPI0016529E91|nr:glutathione S-transferase family protein [Saccharophagus sp. K07]MBC6905368.1 glutathione S-transferase family protein [Saccharophagus sp. K07]